ncbi:tyrosine-type recombinase/integrase [Enterococcus hulanensis]|uniref:tyrosine-type recombinase/integrase n=1 Tax=Enterococcus hulanensis TaxID=2559929 RepID=UPI00288F3C42|nr:tyrosine-type recombinase/integrase [Enterococcus hulanensis]MDT2661069.1 tyrosine-type recombinase/integrase [Enterococcus hulanensis]
MAIEKGTVERLKSGNYRLRVTVGYNENGNPIRLNKTVEAKTQRKAYGELDAWIEDLEEHGYEDVSTITFGNFYENMWKKEARTILEPRTVREYSDIIDNRFLSTFKDKKMREIKPYQIKDIVIAAQPLSKKSTVLSRRTKKRFLNALSSVFSVARDQYRIITHNPVSDVKLPKETAKTKETTKAYSIDEVKLLLKALDGKHSSDKTKALVMTAFVTGAREGEIAAVEEADFDFTSNTVHFHQRIVLNEDKKYERRDGLKASDSKTIPVPLGYMELMKDFMSANQEARKKLRINPKHKYIFGSPEGDFELPTSLYRNWKRFTKRAGLREIRFHDLRHTSASYLLADPNIPIKAVQELLGHKDYRTTMNIYGHALEETKRAASDRFSNLLDKDSNDEPVIE